jgi:adenylate kinase family enzyme
MWLSGICFVNIFNENRVMTLDRRKNICIVLVVLAESKTIKEHIDKGLLLPDDLVLKFVAGELKKSQDKGFLLDGRCATRPENPRDTFFSTGYPRTLNQAELLNKELKVDHVVALNVPNDEIVNRLKDRWIHASSGRVYNLLWNPPKVAVSSVESYRSLIWPCSSKGQR